MTARVSKRAVAVFLAGLAGSCLVGLATSGARILDPHQAVFQFVASGAIAAAVAAAFAVGRPRVAGVVAVLALLLFLAVLGPDSGTRLVRDLVYVPTLVGSVWLAHVGSVKATSIRAGRVVFWGMAFAACHFAAFAILTLVHGVTFDPQLAYWATRIGGLIGIGVGLGVESVGWAMRPRA